MRSSSNTYKLIRGTLLGASLVVWILILADPGGVLSIKHCPVSDAGATTTSMKMLLDMNPISPLLLGWALMVIAMMLPKLIMPIDHIYERSFHASRFRHALLFVVGYMIIWTLTGVLMIAITFALHLLLPASVVPAIAVGIIALVWQFSPIKQQCLNRGHNHPSFAAFGWAANRDTILFGITHGIWCVAGGWAIMLFPMMLSQGHNLAMILVTLIMISEHLEHPQPPRWHLSFRAKLLRIIVMQTHIKLKNIRSYSISR